MILLLNVSPICYINWIQSTSLGGQTLKTIVSQLFLLQILRRMTATSVQFLGVNGHNKRVEWKIHSLSDVETRLYRIKAPFQNDSRCVRADVDGSADFVGKAGLFKDLIKDRKQIEDRIIGREMQKYLDIVASIAQANSSRKTGDPSANNYDL